MKIGGTSGRRHERQRGNALTEFALVSLAFLALLFACFDFGYSIFAMAMLRHSVKEGARFAITGRLLTGVSSHDSSIKEVVRTNAMGLLNGRTDLVKIRYYLPDGSAQTSANAPGNLVEIGVEGFTHRPLGPLFRSQETLAINTTVVDVMEPFTWTPPAR